MNNIDQYKNKYYKYKNKYLNLKYQLGGTKDKKCVNTPQFPIYKHKLNQCCKDEEYKDCRYINHTINFDKIPKVYGLENINKEYDFEKKGIYRGFSLNKERYYNYFLKINFNSATDINTNIFEYVKDLGIGASGSVRQYRYKEDGKEDGKEKYIAVKYFYNPIDLENEKKIIEIMMKNKIVCSELIVKYIPQNDCIIMENAHGTIKDLRGAIRENINILIDILYAIINTIDCLIKNKLYFSDIKMENILYRSTKTGIQIIIADLGGIIYKENITPDIEEFIRSEITLYIGILTLNLLNIYDNDMISNIKSNINQNPEYAKQIIDKLIKDITTNNAFEEIYKDIISNLIPNTLCPPDKRWKLSDILEYITIKQLATDNSDYNKNNENIIQEKILAINIINRNFKLEREKIEQQKEDTTTTNKYTYEIKYL